MVFCWLFSQGRQDLVVTHTSLFISSVTAVWELIPIGVGTT